ncbi:tetratricopeptide repeat protein [Streptomyces sp. NPDC093097]|uniref:tetratricopeptide repeat protein n=1 Tax=Streptomyces sp. NPDC093097 TaxID=3366027 RepID=UPI00381A15B8
MAGRGPSRQELIRRRRRSGFVGRRSEQAAFQQALQQVPEEATQFLFHIHGPGGVGKSTLARQLESAAREAGALTAYVDESVADPIEAMESVSAQLAAQGASSKDLDKALATYRQRRHEADSSLAEAETAAGSPDSATPSPPSASSMVVTQLGLAGLGLIPGVGAFTGAVSAGHVAAGADRLKAMLSAHLRNHEDVRLVLSPLQVLTPIFLSQLSDAARNRPWVVLLFDTYERTGPLLDTWLRDVLVSDRYGELPANVLVLLAGQSRLDVRCWGDWLDLVTDLPLEVFTDDEARHLLATKGVTDERVVEVILKLSEGLPVLVSMLAEARPTDPADVGDPSGTAVERFLKWENDPARRAAALACALPLELDQDICQAALDDEGDEDAAREMFTWLRSLPFVRDHAGRCLYHDVVRNAMLRLQRHQSPDHWREQHTRLAGAFGRQRREIEDRAGSTEADWNDERWRAARLNETYHRLCADPRTALPDALGELVSAYHHDLATLRRWIDALARAGEDTEATAVTEARRRLRAALDQPDPAIAALTYLLSHHALGPQNRALAHALRGRQHRNAERYEQALADYDRAIELGLEGDLAHYGRGLVHRKAHRYQEALADFTRVVEADPTDTMNLGQRALTHYFLGQYEEAIGDYDRALALDPDETWLLTSRGMARHAMGRYEAALADFDRALALSPDYDWALTLRGRTHHAEGRYDEALTDFDRTLALSPDYDWALTLRGRTHQAEGRYEAALADFDQALVIDPDDAWTLADRGRTHYDLGRYEAALADFDRALAIKPDYRWALVCRGLAHEARGHHVAARADYDEALDQDPGYAWALKNRAWTHRLLGDCQASVADYTRLLEMAPGNASALAQRAYVHCLENRYAAALDDLARAVESEPDNDFALTLRGLVHRLTGRYDAALADLTRAVERSPEDGWAHYERAVALHALRDPARDQTLARAMAILERESVSTGDASDVVPVLGNLFLVHFLMPHWDEADRRLTAFLAAQPPAGQLSELLGVMNSLVDVFPAADEHLTPFRRRLTDALARLPGTPPPPGP